MWKIYLFIFLSAGRRIIFSGKDNISSPYGAQRFSWLWAWTESLCRVRIKRLLLVSGWDDETIFDALLIHTLAQHEIMLAGGQKESWHQMVPFANSYRPSTFGSFKEETGLCTLIVFLFFFTMLHCSFLLRCISKTNSGHFSPLFYTICFVMSFFFLLVKTMFRVSTDMLMLHVCTSTDALRKFSSFSS